MYKFSKVVEVLAEVYAVPPERAAAFRSRIQHFQKMKIVPAAPGKGKNIIYTDFDIYKWALCIKLAELGTDTSVTTSIIKKYWKVIKPGFSYGNECHLYLTSSFVTSNTNDHVQFMIEESNIDNAIQNKRAFPGPFTEEIGKRFKAGHIDIELMRITRGVDRAFRVL